MSTWEAIVGAVVDAEGGYVNDPKDPGGETNFGISKRAYPELTISEVTREDAIELFSEDYGPRSGALPAWRMGDDMIAHMLLDTAVNLGIRRTARILQTALGGPTFDGVYDHKLGDRLSAALDDPRDREKLLMTLSIERLRHYTSLSTFDHFGRGWVRRVLNVLETVH